MAYSQGHICHCLTSFSTFRRDFPITIVQNRLKTGNEFVASVQSLAQGLSELGVRRGEVVAIAALNSDWYLEWLLAITFIGAIAAPLNYRWNFHEARLAMELIGPVMLVVDDASNIWWTDLQIDHIVTLRTIVFLTDPPPGFNTSVNVVCQDTVKSPIEGPPSFNYLFAPEGIALICFTSGTTGKPKGVAVTHTALIVQSLAKVAIVGYREDDVFLHTSALCHIGAISSAMAMLMVGGCHIVIPKFEVRAAIKSIEQYKVTSLITVPAIMVDLVAFTSRRQKAWTGGESVKKILNGGGGLSDELIKGATDIFPNAKLFSAYGMTEACSSITFLTLLDPTIRNSSQSCQRSIHTPRKIHAREGVCVGKPAPHVELLIGPGSVVDTCPSAGRILTRGPHLMSRYWENDPSTFNASKFEWIDTGDMGYMDSSGNLWLVGRAKDRIKTGGENVYPQEVEAVVSQHPGVSGVVVVGVPDVRFGEMVAACVRIRKDWRWDGQKYDHYDEGTERLLSSKILQKFCREKNLTRFKIPKAFLLWKKPFPLTTTGKVKRDEVKREATSQLQVKSSSL